MSRFLEASNTTGRIVTSCSSYPLLPIVVERLLVVKWTHVWRILAESSWINTWAVANSPYELACRSAKMLNKLP
jgi:hypothetical protein